ncbi:single stranded nucleic acid binding protein [Serendipita sp. 401]|nr:single stranded nucleic acid binding protein [Serendipita sp. 401]KAG8831647.1 single stranded nucleic acid binding protein [Serendipita sp. 400]KAG9057379.1 single stranded nucleic acid binding protein [Serendipita sp. 407]
MSANPLDSVNPLDATRTEEEHDPHYEPVIRLTDKDQVEVKTHEEDEDVKFKMRAKLFRFDTGSNEWKERGTGDVRLLGHKATGKIRLVMRRDKTFKVCANHAITPEMNLQPNIGSDRSWVWKALADMAEGVPTAETLAIRFANADNANQFKQAFEDAQNTNKEIASSARPETVETSSTDPAGPSASTAKEVTDKENARKEEAEADKEAVTEPVTSGDDSK